MIDLEPEIRRFLHRLDDAARPSSYERPYASIAAGGRVRSVAVASAWVLLAVLIAGVAVVRPGRHTTSTTNGDAPSQPTATASSWPVTTAVPAVTPAGGVPVPNLIGLTEQDAVRTASEAGLAVEVEQQPIGHSANVGRVIMQSPQAGSGGEPSTSVPRGSTIHILVGAQPPSPDNTEPDVATSTTSTAATSLRLLGLGALHLPTGWTVWSVQALPVPSGGIASTRQYFGELASDGISYANLLELTVLPSPGQPDSIPTWAAPGSITNDVNWRSNGFYFDIEWVNLDRSQIEAFITTMSPRQPANPLAGFDSETLPLNVEQIGDGQDLPAESWLNVEVAGPQGRTAAITVYDRAGLANSLGISVERVRIGDRIALASPEAFTTLTGGRTLDWAGSGIQYRVSTSGGDSSDAISLADAVNAVGDKTWLSALHTAAAQQGS